MIILNKDNLLKMGLQIGKELKQADVGTIENAIGTFLTQLPESILNVKKITDNIREVQASKPKQEPQQQPQQQAPLPQDLQQPPMTAEQHNQKVVDDNMLTSENIQKLPITRITQTDKANLNKAIEDTIRFEINGLKVLAEKKKDLIKEMTAEQLIKITVAQEETIIKQILGRFNSL